jgi:hypothetical protein
MGEAGSGVGASAAIGAAAVDVRLGAVQSQIETKYVAAFAVRARNAANAIAGLRAKLAFRARGAAITTTVDVRLTPVDSTVLARGVEAHAFETQQP